MSEPHALDIEPLERAIASLDAGLARQAISPGDDIVRDACIQRFEYTYELSHKMLKRYLAATSANPLAFDAMAFPDLIRTGSERGLLLSDWSRWRLFRTARSLTSHSYDEQKARDVFAVVPEFLKEARYLSRSVALGMTQTLDLKAGEATIVRDILTALLPAGVAVRVFGSRAKDAANPYSDLDLALIGSERMPLAVLADLAEAFTESDLPYKVDVVDGTAAGSRLRETIDRDGVELSLDPRGARA